MVATTQTRWCGDCAADAVFERFDCADHPEDCVELVCTACGSGVEAAGSSGGAPAASRRSVQREAAA